MKKKKRKIKLEIFFSDIGSKNSNIIIMKTKRNKSMSDKA